VAAISRAARAQALTLIFFRRNAENVIREKWIDKYIIANLSHEILAVMEAPSLDAPQVFLHRRTPKQRYRRELFPLRQAQQMLRDLGVFLFGH